jgi:AcrR family transcriptional regulator
VKPADGSTIRDRILAVSTGLFAERGYAGNGIRDIARAADVSVSMVSYHFGGKIGILREIFDSFFREYGTVVTTALCSGDALETKVHNLVAETTGFMKSHQAAFRIVTTELPHLRGEAHEFQARYLSMIHDLTDRWLLPDVEGRSGCPDHDVLHTIVGPALLSMIYSTFLFGDGLEQAFDFVRTDSFYDEYVDTISHLILSALEGLAETQT